MYDVKEITLKNGETERKDLVIEFTDPDMAIIGEFLMTDAPLLETLVEKEIERVLAGETDMIVSGGNRCRLVIKAKQTRISDLLEGYEDVNTFPPYTINTVELQQLIRMWIDKRKEFKKKEFRKKH